MEMEQKGLRAWGHKLSTHEALTGQRDEDGHHDDDGQQVLEHFQGFGGPAVGFLFSTVAGHVALGEGQFDARLFLGAQSWCQQAWCSKIEYESLFRSKATKPQLSDCSCVTRTWLRLVYVKCRMCFQQYTGVALNSHSIEYYWLLMVVQ